MGERDVALIKSLLGIVGKGQGAEWVYSESDTADVVIVDTDNRGSLSALKSKPRVIITYASPDSTLVPNAIFLAKPARARELMEVLTSVQAKLEKA
jgi:fructose-specific component phosphotransferase system IIB-like protein